MSSPLPASPDLELEKKQAKALLKAYRAGDATAAVRMHAVLPRLASAGARATLADAQLVQARERGFESWPKLKAHIEAQRPLAELVVEFLKAACNGRHAAAARLLEKAPSITGSIHAACAAAHPMAVSAALGRDAAAVSMEQPQLGGVPLVYACASAMYQRGNLLAAASVRCVEMLLDRGADPNAFTLANRGDPASDRLSVLFHAANAGNAPVVRLLLERGAAANDGESIYHAAERNHRDSFAPLLAPGAELSDSRA